MKYFQRFSRVISDGGKIGPRLHKKPWENRSANAAKAPSRVARDPFAP
jgi:hypothetical protein